MTGNLSGLILIRRRIFNASFLVLSNSSQLTVYMQGSTMLGVVATGFVLYVLLLLAVGVRLKDIQHYSENVA